jgi:hypothetical protein
MKNKIKFCLILLAATLTVVSCYKEETFFDDPNNIQYLNQPVPAVFLNTLDSTSFTRGNNRIRMHLEYITKDNLSDSVYIYATVNSTAVPTAAAITDRLVHKAAFSSIKQADTLIYFYTLPATTTVGATVRLNAEIVTKQGARKGTWATGAGSTRSFTVK